MIKSKRRFVILLFLLFIALFILSYQKKSQSLLNEILIYPVDILNRTTSHIYKTFADLYSMSDENERLKRQLMELHIERQRYSEIMLENKRLRDILGLKENNPLFLTTARPVARGYDRLLNTIVIDKGKEDGIKKDMAVITANGIVGKIYAVRDKYSDILLLQDPNFSVAVRLQNSRHEGIVSGTGRSYCQLKYIPPEYSVEKNEPVITSGIDGIFPPGILVGVISYIGKDGTDLFQYLEVTPYQSGSKVEEVIILKPFTDRTLIHGSKN